MLSSTRSDDYDGRSRRPETFLGNASAGKSLGGVGMVGKANDRGVPNPGVFDCASLEAEPTKALPPPETLVSAGLDAPDPHHRPSRG